MGLIVKMKRNAMTFFSYIGFLSFFDFNDDSLKGVPVPWIAPTAFITTVQYASAFVFMLKGHFIPCLCTVTLWIKVEKRISNQEWTWCRLERVYDDLKDFIFVFYTRFFVYTRLLTSLHFYLLAKSRASWFKSCQEHCTHVQSIIFCIHWTL